MQPFSVPVLPTVARIRPRTALVASADRSFRQRLNEILTGLRWQVREAASGAEAWTETESAAPEAVIVDSWLPDLDHREFLKDFRTFFPEVDLLTTGGNSSLESPRGPHRQELLYALRRSQDTDTAAWNTAPVLPEGNLAGSASTGKASFPTLVSALASTESVTPMGATRNAAQPLMQDSSSDSAPGRRGARPGGNVKETAINERLPELVGNAPCMLEISRRIRLVASALDSSADRRADGLRQGTGCRSIAPAVDAQPQAVCGHQLRRNSRGAS